VLGYVFPHLIVVTQHAQPDGMPLAVAAMKYSFVVSHVDAIQIRPP
jgi:hypothetical protein